MEISLEDRCIVIVRSFITAYFGHVPVQSPIWNNLHDLCIKYFAYAAHTQHDLKATRDCLSSQLTDVVEHHELTRFPVSPKLKSEVAHWMKRVLDGDTTSNGNIEFEEPEYIFKSFERNHLEYVTLLEENRNIIGHGTTGLTSWQGAMFLTDWLTKFTSFLTNQRVIELGSGSGLLGLSLLRSFGMESFIFTDCHVKVINAIINNLQLNFPSDSSTKDLDPAELLEQTQIGPHYVIPEEKIRSVSYHQRIGHCSTAVQHLDWLKYDVSSLPKVDVILGSDIVYERAFLPPLCGLIQDLLKLSDAMDPTAYIACTERSFTTLDCFNDELKKHGLSYAIISKGSYSPTETIVNSDVSHQATRLYRIKLTGNLPQPERGLF
ncbi:hypothetical protein TCAL_02886 [Tigriopus californicus]|uniref:FAM86 N-terminal domain-containing protein n=1 Tax=Tigriopus californicus TaxID=6832 RepID=A0A553NY82_TIGCA|nr:protein-lysine N-methyltransferase EEF2KMT-like [Tigriopus californicus]TRY70380.1 hypothetical protein TCAL_02886 [Tigriopus californicus]|eukprot:TCALIF_02886-PA protein Name:"Similar to FAM86A Protein FAM86A (Bos taurus)" AED:0.09 eAED:0.10 QI:0/-1/0/1/-1/1/1/0/377